MRRTAGQRSYGAWNASRRSLGENPCRQHWTEVEDDTSFRLTVLIFGPRIGSSMQNRREAGAMRRRIHRKKGLASRLADLPGGRLGIFLARNRPVLKSLAVFVGIILAFILALPVYRGFINGPFSVAVANSTGFLLRVFGVGARATGTSVISPMFSVEVIPACSGIFAYILFLAAVLAYPCKLKAKAMGIALGFATIFILNLVRMVSLFYIGTYLPQFFEVAHLLFWQSLMIACTALLWFFWAQWLAHVRQ